MSPARRRWLALLVGLLLWAAMPAWTPPRGGLAPIHELERVQVRDAEQQILLRGADRRAPVLLFLHGGPGVPVPFLAPLLHADLEKRLVVVHWDQPGAGRSCDVAPRPTELAQLRADALVIIDHLRARFQVDRVLLAGASFGSLVGLPLAAEHPERVSGWIGESQVVNVPAAEHVALEVARQEAALRQDAEAIATLAALDAPLDDPRDVGRLRRELNRGGHLVHRPWALLRFLPRLLFGPEHTVPDRLRYPGCLVESAAALASSVRAEALDQTVQQLSVPALFVHGRHDLVAPLALVEPMAARLGASLVVLEAGHLPSIEQPDAFAAAVLGWVDGLANPPTMPDIREDATLPR